MKYQSGFANHFETEAHEGALPIGQNNPQKASLGLYAEQLSGSAFTTSREDTLRTWFYRIQPSVTHKPYERTELPNWKSPPFNEFPPTPDQLRWDPLPEPNKPTDFLEGMTTICGNGDVASQLGCAAHIYVANRSMETYFYNADGHLLLVPQDGRLDVATEMGVLEAQPGEIAVIPKGIKIQVKLRDKTARGYVCENYGTPFRLPELGPIGTNGLANPRDFLAPVAAFEEKRGDFKIIGKFQGHFWAAASDHSPLDVVAWHGNYTPYKYDLYRFNTIGSISYDHPDPSIFTVLTAPSDTPGVANIDFVIFPPRWLVAEDTFRPPWYHRNIMSEYMGLIHGVYDAKLEGFVPGGGSLHNSMSAHGPAADVYEKASSGKLSPAKLDKTMAIMFESRYPFCPTEAAMAPDFLQKNYYRCWENLRPEFKS